MVILFHHGVGKTAALLSLRSGPDLLLKVTVLRCCALQEFNCFIFCTDLIHLHICIKPVQPTAFYKKNLNSYTLDENWELSGRVLDSRLRGRWFEPHGRHCIVSLSKTH